MDNHANQDKLYSTSSTTQEDSFFDTTDVPSPEYDNAVNQNSEPIDEEARARQQEEWKEELAKLEDEITTLRQVLAVKVRQSSELKRKMGITPMVEFKQDLKQGFQNIRESDAYQKTSAGLKNVGSKTSTAFSSFGSYTSKKLGDMRNSNTFKSFEEKIGGAYSNVKTRVRGSRSEQNFEDVLHSTVNEREEVPPAAASAPTTPGDTPKLLPEEKVPL